MPDGHAQNRNPLTALQMSRSDLIAYQVGMDANYRPALHHRVIGAALMEVEAGNIDRLRLEAPPRHGKTRQCGVDFMSWIMGRNPQWNCLYVTYNKDRATDVGFQVRENFANGFHQRCFPASRIDHRSRSATKFDLRRIMQAGGQEKVVGGYRAIGLGGPATGRGFDMIGLDDTAKDRQQADSPAYKRLLENRFSSSIYTRSEGHGGIFSMMTRWGENDLHGHIEREYGQDGWITIRLPAEGGPGDFLNRPLGEALWPDRWPKEKLQRIKNSIFARDWMALYQQEPTSIDGLKFSKRWFQWYDIAPVTKMNLYMTVDYAVTEDQERDFTEMYIWGIDHRGHIWLLDGYYGQVTPDKWATEEMALLKAHRPRLLFEETGAIRNATTSLLATLRRDNGRYVTRIALPAVADKVANVTSFQALAAMGMIHMPRSHPKQIGTRLVEQLLAFPTGEHDDGVDNCGLIGRGRDMMMRAQIASGKTSGGIRPFTAEWLHFEEKDDDGLRDC